jgi:hypothetical protein
MNLSIKICFRSALQTLGIDRFLGRIFNRKEHKNKETRSLDVPHNFHFRFCVLCVLCGLMGFVAAPPRQVNLWIR